MAVLMASPDGFLIEVDSAVLATNLWARRYTVVEPESETPAAVEETEPPVDPVGDAPAEDALDD